MELPEVCIGEDDPNWLQWKYGLFTLVLGPVILTMQDVCLREKILTIGHNCIESVSALCLVA